MYSFPAWRRAPFIALLIIIFVIAYAPATTQGTATVRLAALVSPSNVSHMYVSLSSIQVNRVDTPDNDLHISPFGPLRFYQALLHKLDSLSQWTEPGSGSAQPYHCEHDSARRTQWNR